MSSSGPKFNILGSAALNTPDGKNPPTTGPTTGTTSATGGLSAQKPVRPVDLKSDEYKQQCRSAHDALEDRLREEERLARWRRQ